MPKPSERDRQTRILDAAEDAIAEPGFAGASLRHIVTAARVNLATVYYYFRSKRGLMEAVLTPRLGPLRQEHLALLRRFEAAAHGRPLPVGQILEAMLLPPLRLAAQAPAQHQAVTRLLGRIVTEPNPLIQEVLRSQRAEVRDAFLRRFSAVCRGHPCRSPLARGIRLGRIGFYHVQSPQARNRDPRRLQPRPYREGAGRDDPFLRARLPRLGAGQTQTLTLIVEPALQPTAAPRPGETGHRALHLVDFFCRAPQAKSVSLVGDFNDWQPTAHPMTRMPDGGWVIRMELPHGHHQYSVPRGRAAHA